MKKITAYSLLILLTFMGCRKDDNSKLPELEKVPLPLVVKLANADQLISAANPSSFNGKFTVDLYFHEGGLPQKFDVVAIKNGDPSTVKVIQENVTTFPSTITITGDKLISLFGSIQAGDNFDISVDITTLSGKKYLAFPPVGIGYGPNVNIQPGASTFVRYSAICVYNATLFPTGQYTVLQDDWADYHPGDVVTLTQIDATHISFEYLANNPLPIIITIDPATNSTSATKQQYGDYGPPFGDWFVQSVNSPDNVVAPCAQEIGIRLHHTSSNNFDGGENTIRFKKK
jgi:hypothetical protein